MNTIISSLLREHPKSGILFTIESTEELWSIAFQLSCYIANLVCVDAFLKIQESTKDYRETVLLNGERKKDQIVSLLNLNHKTTFMSGWKEMLDSPVQFNSILYIDNLSLLNSENSRVVLSNLNELDRCRHMTDDSGYFNSILSTLCTEEWSDEFLGIIHSMTNCLFEIESDQRIRCTYKKSSGKLCITFFKYSFIKEQDKYRLQIEEEKEVQSVSEDNDVLRVQGETKFMQQKNENEESNEVDIYMTHSDDEDFDLDDDLDI